MRLKEILEKVREEISGESAKSYASSISGFHRIQASPGFHRAVEYVSSQLIEMGLEPEIYEYLSDGEVEYFSWPSPVGWEILEGELWITKPKKVCLGRFRENPTFIVAHSNSTPLRGVETEVVDVGMGEGDEDYEGKHVEGKFVLACGDLEKVHTEAVVKRKALGVLTYDVKRIDVPNAIVYRGIWPLAKELDRVGVVFSLSLKNAERIKEYLRRGESVKVWARVDSRFFKSKIEVVSTLFKGREEDEVLIIAHLCHPNPGANDNASGSGLLLEIARTLKSLMKRKEIKELGMGIRLMWVPEMYGTLAFLQENPNSDRVKYCLNLDMVGENQEKCGSVLTMVRTPESLPSHLTYVAGIILDRVFGEGAKQFGGVDKLPAKKWKITKYTTGSDHYIFADSTIGVPSIAFIHWPDRFYHTSLDTPDKIDPGEMERVGVTALSIALFLSSPNDKDLIWMVEESIDRCIAEIMEATEETIREALNRENTSRNVQRGILRVKYLSKWKRESIKSFLKLSERQLIKKVVEIGVKRLESVEKEALSRIKRICGCEESRFIEEMSDVLRKIPSRIVKAPISFRKFRKIVGEEEYEWYRRKFRDDETLRVKIDEALNFMDGSRDLGEIYRAVEAEYGGLELGDFLKIMSDLKRTGFIKL